MPSKGKQCKPVDAATAPCKRSRDGQHKPIVLNKACPRCNEWRCKAHCKCGRNGEAKGRHAPRGSKPLASSNAPQSMPTCSVHRHNSAVQLPLANPQPTEPPIQHAQLVVDTLVGKHWISKVVEDIGKSSTVTIASYSFDHPVVHRALMDRLKGHDKFTCEILVDKEQYETGGSSYMAPRLRSLQKAGALIFLCHGPARTKRGRKASTHGSMHLKLMLVDGEIAYHGSANYTLAAERNWDCVVRLVGHPVIDMLGMLVALKTDPLTERL